MAYDNKHEKFPIEPGQIWKSQLAQVSVCDITKSLPKYFDGADMIYSDPPWSLGNVNMFNSKAGREYMNNYSEFYQHLFIHIARINPRICYLEIGEQNVGLFLCELSKIYQKTQAWKIKYYKKHDCWLLRGSHESYIDFDYTGLDDTETPTKAISLEQPKCVGDFCTGRGLTAIGAMKNGVRFVGTELNKEKLSVCLSNLSRMGQSWQA